MAAIGDQSIELGYGLSVITRIVYDLRNNESLGFQTGYVQYDSSEVAVWRPYDPADDSANAKWRTGRWFNIYTLKLTQIPGVRHRRYLTHQIGIAGTVADVPKVELEFMMQFKRFLSEAKAQKKKP